MIIRETNLNLIHQLEQTIEATIQQGLQQILTPEDIDELIAKLANQLIEDYQDKRPIFIGIMVRSY